jgi:hypothetical protein
MASTRVLVCGGRKFQNWELLRDTLDNLCFERGWTHPPDEYGNTLPNVTIIEGGAKGADYLAADWAMINWTRLETYKADWEQYGRSAGYIRNKQMLEEGKPDLVVAFPGGVGTAMMVKIAREAGVEVIEVDG